MCLLKVENLAKTYRVKELFKSNSVEALKNLSFELPGKSSLAVVGESGSGKTTLARILAGLEKPTSGTFRFKPGYNLAMVFQDNYSSFNPYRTLYQVITEACSVRGQQVEKEILDQLLSDLDLPPGLMGSLPSEVSGGQRQRAGIARALLANPKVLLLDEPVSALDISVQAKLLKLLVELKSKKDLQFIVVTHDLQIVPLLADYILILEKGRLVEYGPVAQVIQHPQQQYTRALLNAHSEIAG